jgi:hypothetical protein
VNDLFRALGALVEAPAPGHERLAGILGLPGAPDPADHTTLFLLNLYPYASVHLGEEGMLGGEARDRVAGFWRALALTPPAEPDHLGALIGLLAALLDREAEEEGEAERLLWTQARAALLKEHLLPWLPAYLGRVREVGGPFYGAWAALLDRAVAEEWARTRDALDGPAEGLPVPLRALPALPDPRTGDEGGEAFLQALLASARSGMILTRQDLARAGRTLGLGVRVGERAYVIKALLAQDANATLAWLAAEARVWRDRHAEADPASAITDFWRDRAAATADLLDQLASDEAPAPWTASHADALTPTATEAHHA